MKSPAENVRKCLDKILLALQQENQLVFTKDVTMRGLKRDSVLVLFGGGILSSSDVCMSAVKKIILKIFKPIAHVTYVFSEVY